jgi:hypothetical protein
MSHLRNSWLTLVRFVPVLTFHAIAQIGHLQPEESSETDQQGIAQNQNSPEIRAAESSGATDLAEAEETKG